MKGKSQLISFSISALLVITLGSPISGQASNHHNSSRTLVPSTGEFTNINAPLVGSNFGSLTWGDYDRDNRLDLLQTGNNGHAFGRTLLYHNDGGDTFSTIDTALPRIYGKAAWGDYDNDGNLDVLLSGINGDVPTNAIYHNNGDGSFSNANVAIPLNGYSAIAWADYDRDGKLDFIIRAYDDATHNPATRLYHNEGNGQFSDSGIYLAGTDGGNIAWADYDKDGYPDLLFGSPATLYHNDAGTGFSVAAAGLGTIYQGYSAWGDYDSDGYLDLLTMGVSANEPITKLYHNNHDGSFSENSNANLPAVKDGELDWGDYDNDGRLDIAITGDDGSAPLSLVYHNNGDGTFSDINANLQQLQTSSLAWGDYNNDGRLDLTLMGLGGNAYTLIYRNDTTTNNAPPSASATLSTTILSPTAATLAWSPASDDHTPSNGLSYNVRIGTTPGGSDVLGPMTQPDGRRLLPQLGNAYANTSYTINNLIPGSTYYWSVQALDTAFMAGPFATEGSFTLPLAPTPTPQPSVCPNPFVDISTNIFFHAINALYCDGVINGTDATHYSPAGTATRAQFAKIVTLAFGLPLTTPAQPTFSDVPTDYWAYTYIETGYAQHILSGFDQASCANFGQPYPCYLPGLAINRGQLTKLVVSAGHYPLLTPSQPSFTDVPASNVFYTYIETAHAAGIINGYPDHTFRPNNIIRRDEMAQIVYTAQQSPAAATATPPITRTATPTFTPVPTDTPIPATVTDTPLPATMTDTPVPATPSATVTP